VKNLKIFLINIVIVLMVIAGITLYIDRQKKQNYNNSIKAYENTVTGLEKVMASYMHSEQQLVDSWAKIINGKPMTMDYVMVFAKEAIKDENASIHIVWADDYSIGYSTQSHLFNKDDYSISYKEIEALHTYEMSPSKVLHAMDFSVPGIHMTPSYTNPITGSKVIAFCQQITLYDMGSPRTAIMLYILPVKYLNEKWVFGLDYSNLGIAIIEKNGNYIIQPKTMKNTSFYEFMYSYNKITEEKISNLIFNNKVGSFVAKDAKKQDNIYAYAVIKSTMNHAVVISMSTEELGKTDIDWIIIVLTMVALLISLVSNTIFFNLLAKKLAAALAQAQRANTAKTVFLSNMSHDIRTPMNAIIGFTNLAISHIDNKEQAIDYLGKINTSSNHLLSLINDVLDMSRIENGKIEIEEKKEDILTIVKNLQTFINADVNSKQLSFSMQFSECPHSKVYCDKLRLNQIFLNLLSNAIKFTNPGGSISLSAEELLFKNGTVTYEFHVCDTGIGMKPEFIEKIYEPFERERNTTVSGIQGTGLGMSITKSLVDMMNGVIFIDSKVNNGTDIKVVLSFKTYEEDIPEAVIEPKEEKLTLVEATKKTDFTGKTVLLVEDNELNQEIAAEILKSFGLEVLLANDGLDAINTIKKAEKNSISLVLMDIQMPNMNGYEATKIIRRLDDAEKAKIPILAMTANAFEEDKRNALSAGMDGHLAKPINITELIKQLNIYLG